MDSIGSMVGRDREGPEDSGSLKIIVLGWEAGNVSECAACLLFQEDKARLSRLAF